MQSHGREVQAQQHGRASIAMGGPKYLRLGGSTEAFVDGRSLQFPCLSQRRVSFLSSLEILVGLPQDFGSSVGADTTWIPSNSLRTCSSSASARSCRSTLALPQSCWSAETNDNKRRRRVEMMVRFMLFGWICVQSEVAILPRFGFLKINHGSGGHWVNSPSHLVISNDLQ